MIAVVVSALLAVPYSPTPVTPPNGGWTRSYGELTVSPYADDAGIAWQTLELELRRADAGYGDAGLSAGPSTDYGIFSNLDVSPEQSHWCWHGRYRNVMNQASPYGPEACFEDDETAPLSPYPLDGGPPIGTGTVSLTFPPAVDTLSGVYGYQLITGPTPTGPWYAYVDPVPGPPPLKGVLGPGTWYVFAAAYDFAGNSGSWDVPPQLLYLSVLADLNLPVPPTPDWAAPVYNGFGEELLYDYGWAVDAGMTDMVGSFCDIDAGCLWQLGFTAQPLSTTGGSWVQTEDEGFFIARIAAIRAGVVGKWSKPTPSITIVDRTPPVVFAPFVTLMGDGGVLVQWQTPADPLSGLASVQLLEDKQGGGTTGFAVTGMNSLQRTLAPGQYSWRLLATDVATNSRTGPSSNPLIVAPSVDAGTPDAGTPNAGGADAGGADAGAADAGMADAGTPDAGVADAGARDAGTLDAGVADAGAVDSGTPDAGAPDGGAGDAGPDASHLQLGCGCGETSPVAPLLVLAALGLVRRRQRT